MGPCMLIWLGEDLYEEEMFNSGLNCMQFQIIKLQIHFLVVFLYVANFTAMNTSDSLILLTEQGFLNLPANQKTRLTKMCLLTEWTFAPTQKILFTMNSAVILPDFFFFFNLFLKQSCSWLIYNSSLEVYEFFHCGNGSDNSHDNSIYIHTCV